SPRQSGCTSLGLGLVRIRAVLVFGAQPALIESMLGSGVIECIDAGRLVGCTAEVTISLARSTTLLVSDAIFGTSAGILMVYSNRALPRALVACTALAVRQSAKPDSRHSRFASSQLVKRVA